MGEYQHKLDSKGRLTLPAQFREHLGDTFVLTRGLDNCLFAYPRSQWEQLEEQFKSLPFTRADTRAFVRFFFSGAAECSLDSQGRVLIPANLRDHARLEKEAIIIGVSTRMEIWSELGWRNYAEKTEVSYEDIAEKIEDFDLTL